MGVDYGSKRVGIAVSDEGLRIAFPKTTLKNEKIDVLIKDLKRLIADEDVAEVVIGLPLGLEGQETEASSAVRGCAEKLKAEVSVPIHFENEMFTTKMAIRDGVKKKQVDAASAAIILQSYLDKHLR